MIIIYDIDPSILPDKFSEIFFNLSISCLIESTLILTSPRCLCTIVLCFFSPLKKKK